MTWSTTWSEHEHDILFLREVLVSDLLMYRKSSVERGKVWDDIADQLNALEHPTFRANQRYLRDKLNKLIKCFKKKNTDELRASGISPDDDEKSQLLEEIIEKLESTVPVNLSKKRKVEEDKETAEAVRRKAMETSGATTKRNKEGDEQKTAKKRRSGNEAMVFLREKAKLDHNLRQAEFEAKQRNEKASNKRMEQQNNFQTALVQLLAQQQQDNSCQQEQQQQQNILMMQQQQSILSYLQELSQK